MPPPTNRVMSAASPLSSDIERLLRGRLHEPRQVLGLHPSNEQTVVVRALLPNALRVRLVEPAVELERVPGTALFEWKGPRDGVTTPYRLRFESNDGRWHEIYDPYSFPLEIDDHDLARFAGGTHIHAHRFLGAHERTIAGVRGIRFAVWAPNAERVSVVGTFNHWDGRYHAMSVRGSSGVWELFVPEIGPGELYKYEIYTRDSRELKLKSDPYAAAFEQRPATAAVTRFTGSRKLTSASIQIRAPKTAIMPNSTVTAPPSTPIGMAVMIAPNLGNRPSPIAITPAIRYASVE